jgi:hypothetical protein
MIKIQVSGSQSKPGTLPNKVLARRETLSDNLECGTATALPSPTNKSVEYDAEISTFTDWQLFTSSSRPNGDSSIALARHFGTSVRNINPGPFKQYMYM